LCLTPRSEKQEKYAQIVIISDKQIIYPEQTLLDRTSFNGRSVYLCKSWQCLNNAIKGNRLKGLLEGRRGKAKGRVVHWPFEPQIMHVLSTICPKVEKTCQNTQGKEGAE
jgi:predicted RNA-binding protein YlxR (DUF448 family)